VRRIPRVLGRPEENQIRNHPRSRGLLLSQRRNWPTVRDVDCSPFKPHRLKYLRWTSSSSSKTNSRGSRCCQSTWWMRICPSPLQNSATRQLGNSATQQLSNSATQQLSNSATQQLSNSATQQLSNSATQHSLAKFQEYRRPREYLEHQSQTTSLEVISSAPLFRTKISIIDDSKNAFSRLVKHSKGAAMEYRSTIIPSQRFVCVEKTTRPRKGTLDCKSASFRYRKSPSRSHYITKVGNRACSRSILTQHRSLARFVKKYATKPSPFFASNANLFEFLSFRRSIPPTDSTRHVHTSYILRAASL
jgi:hypothetical protein